MTVRDSITSKLTSAFDPVHLEVIDESALHAGHAGARPGGETHFRVVLRSPAIAGQSRVAVQRRIHRVLAEELAGPVHALSIDASAEPGHGR